MSIYLFFFFFQAEDGIRDLTVTGVQTCALPISILSHYRWVEPEGLQYFRNRLAQAPRDAEHALALVTERFRTRADQERAVAALDFKCDVLWCLLDAVERGPLPGWEA